MSRKRFVMAVTAVVVCSAVALLFGGGPTFHPDATLTGSTLAGWHMLGDADWHIQDGEITGTPKQPTGGWLILNNSYQDVGFFSSFQCTTGCRTGVLLRAEKTPDGGMKGIFVALDGVQMPGETPIAQTEQGKSGIASYAVTLDAQGKETKRTRLRSGGGQMRIAPPPDPNAAGRGGGGRGGSGGRGGGGRGAVLNLPIPRPDTGLNPGEWNQVEILLDANIVRGFLNIVGSETGGGVVDDEDGRFGPIALYSGGTGEVHFKDVAYKNLALKVRPPEITSTHFREQRLSDFYYSWGAGAADINHDGVMDIVSGPHVFYGPDYTKHSEIYLAIASNPSDTYTYDDWMQFVADFEGNGWPDALNCNFSGGTGIPGCWLYSNPKNEPRRWDKHLVVSAYSSEIGVVRDLLGDGKPTLVYAGGGFVRYARPDPANPTGPWLIRSVSDNGYANAHGIGVGDVNGDGRMDIVNAFGWWEQPADEKQQAGTTIGSAAAAKPWKYHPAPFGRYGRNGVGGSVMGVYDVNGDGLNDVVTSLNAHGFGLAWFEQKKDGSFVEHMIMDDFGTKNSGGVTFTEPHGTAFADVDGDGITDLIVGKRFWSHRDDFLDPDAYGPAVLYWYKTVRNPKAPGGAEFVPELINNHSGAGSDIYVADLNKDGAMDILTATRFGTFVFWGKPGAYRAATTATK
jgi:hypothetical protein